MLINRLATLKDRKTGETFRIRLCKYCLDYKGQPKPIMPDDFLARREKDGSYKCGVCVQEDIDNAIVKANPNSEKSQKIIAKRQREEAIDKLNKELYQRSRRIKR
jgi:formate dehydrogenase assembly factor FdhD